MRVSRPEGAACSRPLISRDNSEFWDDYYGWETSRHWFSSTEALWIMCGEAASWGCPPVLEFKELAENRLNLVGPMVRVHIWIREFVWMTS